MTNKEIIEKLSNLASEIKLYAQYLENSTYHPYDKVEDFYKKLNSIIEDIHNKQ